MAANQTPIPFTAETLTQEDLDAIEGAVRFCHHVRSGEYTGPMAWLFKIDPSAGLPEHQRAGMERLYPELFASD